jgi:5-methylthioadenosine/S-adenosylhomocysteine deaminase
MDSSRERLEPNIDILIEENKIKKIGKNILADGTSKIIDASNKYVLPGFINTHSHIGMSIFRETIDGLGLQDWLTKKIWPIEDNLTPDDIYNSSLLSCIEMIKTGTTTVNDHYFFPKSVINAVLKSGMRAEITRVLMDVADDLDGRIIELTDVIENYSNKYDTISINVGIHGLYTASSACVERAIEIAKKYNLNVHIHFCENSGEVQQIKERYNVEVPSEVIKKYFSDVNTILAHCVKLSDDDIKILKDLHVSVSHCPVSNLKLGCGVARLPELMANNINVSLGTDGQGSGSSLDMFDTMKLTALLQKGINENPKLLPAYDVLKMATINGAIALNKEDLIGSITENKLADLIILDLSGITLQPINDVFSDIVYNAKGNDVVTTIVNGKILMEDRKLVDLDENEVLTYPINLSSNVK